jgi:hypothetical protein
MPASVRSCDVCGREFYGRADANYCTTACRQKAYRQRSANAGRTIDLPTKPAVPVGDEWMKDRFGTDFIPDYTPVAEMAEHIRARFKSPGVRAKHMAEAEGNALRTIRGYVEAVAAVRRTVWKDEYSSDEDFETPLGDVLPEAIDPTTAAELASALTSALPRVLELASLLTRRANERRTAMCEKCNAEIADDRDYCSNCDGVELYLA